MMKNSWIILLFVMIVGNHSLLAQKKSGVNSSEKEVDVSIQMSSVSTPSNKDVNTEIEYSMNSKDNNDSVSGNKGESVDSKLIEEKILMKSIDSLSIRIAPFKEEY